MSMRMHGQSRSDFPRNASLRRSVCRALLLCFALPLGASLLRAQSTNFLGKVVHLPDSSAEIFSPATGRTISPKEKPYTVGDRVKKGDPVVIIEHRYNMHDQAHISNQRWDLLKVLLDTRYRALVARVARERGERLMSLGNLSGQQLQHMQAEELDARAEYEKARTLIGQQDEQIGNVSPTRKPLASPIDGEIAEATFTQNQTVNEGFKLYRIVNLAQVGVAARVIESQFRPWPMGTTAGIRFDNLPGKVFTGTLEIIEPAVDPETRTRELIFRVSNPDELLRFGMIGRVEVTQ
ncbi:MAG: HlyD family efflux transporter periplasmic adaptor subunit [Acidobacteria bacterium]|nr:HlyD family efflux transporter periplasmic adaptor subunit [Acidobacteriota bacterium]